MSSVAQIVQKIIDDLSDGISQLVLMVVVLQEQNAPVPPQLPQAAQVVLKTAATLVKIARSLADNNYKAFPDIKAEIHDAASKVEVSIDTMSNAIRALSSTSDRKKGWEGLVEACRIMSGKTIKLLQIVYGAELKRLFATAEQLLEGFDQLDPIRAGTDPQGFANDASDLASKANQMAQWLNQKANDEESPIEKQKLKDLAQKLANGARGLINDVNDLLSQPTDPRKQRKVQDAIDGLKDGIRDAKQALEDNRTDFPKDMKLSQMPGQDYAPRYDPNPFESISPLQKALDNIERGAKTDDPRQVKDSVKDAAPLGRAVQDKVRQVLDQIPDAGNRQKAKDALGDFENTFPEMQKAAQDYLRDPNNPYKRDKLANNAAEVKDMLDDMDDALRGRPEDPLDAIDKLMRTLDNMGDAARQQPVDKDGLRAGNDKIPRQNNNVLNASRAAADKEPNPSQKKRINDAIAAVSRAVPDAKNAADRVQARPDASNISPYMDKNQKAMDALDDLRNALQGDPFSAIDQLRKDMDKVPQAAAAGDQDKLQQVGKNDVPKHHRNVQDLCKDYANKMPDPQQRRKVEQALNDLARQVPKDQRAVDNVLRDPNSEPKKKGLANDCNDTKDILDKLKNALLGVDPNSDAGDISPLYAPAQEAKKKLDAVRDAAKKGDKPELKNKVEDAKQALDQYKDRAKDYADDLYDPQRKNAVYDTIDDIDRLFPAQIAAATDLVDSPNDRFKAGVLDNDTDGLKSLVDELADGVTPDSIADQAKKAMQKLADLDAAKRAGNEPEVKKLKDEIDDLVGDIGGRTKMAAARADAPVYAKNALAAADNLADAMGQLAKDVNNKAPANKISGDAAKVKGALQDLIDQTNAEPIGAIDKLIKTLNKVDNASDKNPPDLPKLKKQGAKVAPQGKDVSKLTRDAARKCEDPAQTHLINGCLDQVEKQMPKELGAIKDRINAPNDPAKKAQCADDTDALIQRLEDLKDALQGKLDDDEKKMADVMRAVDELARLGPKLDNAIKTARDNPGDKQNPKRIKQVAQELEDPMQKIHDAALNPEDEVPYAAEAIKNAAKKLGNAAHDNDKPAAASATKELGSAARDLANKAKGVAGAMQAYDPQSAKDLLKAADEVNKLVPAYARAARDALDDPNNEGKLDKVDDLGRQLKKAADRAGKAASPVPEEKTMRDAKKRCDEAMDRIRGAAARGDKNGMRDGFRDLNKAGDDFKRAYRRRKGPIKFLPTDDTDPMDELKRLWKKFGVGKDRMMDNPKDKKTNDDWNDWANKLKKAQDDAIKEINAPKVAAVQDVEDALNRLDDAARRNDAPGFGENARDLVDKTKALNAMVAAEPDQRLKKDLQDALKTVPNLVRQIVNDGKDALKNPNDDDKKKKVAEDADRMGYPLALAKKLLQPTTDRDIAAKIAKAKKDHADLKGAIRDNGNVRPAKDELVRDTKDVADAVRSILGALPPHKKDNLAKIADALEQAGRDLQSKDAADKPSVAKQSDKIHDLLDDLQAGLDADDKDELIRAKAKCKSIMASLRDLGEDMDPMSLLDAAQDLRDALGNLMDFSLDWAKDQGPGTSDKARNALDLDQALRELEGTNPGGYKPAQSIDSLMAALDDSPPIEMAVADAPPVGNTFEEVIERVAWDVRQAVNKCNDPAESQGLAEALARLAAAAKAGKRQEMIVAARAVAAQINKLMKYLKELAGRVAAKNPMYQDKLIKYAHRLRNLSTQLKILVSVKASSVERDNDQDETLASITRVLGNALTESLTTVSIVKVSILKERN